MIDLAKLAELRKEAKKAANTGMVEMVGGIEYINMRTDLVEETWDTIETLYRENAELRSQDGRWIDFQKTQDRLAKLEAVAKAAPDLLSGHDNLYIAHFGPKADPLNDIAAKPMREALAALKEDSL